MTRIQIRAIREVRGLHAGLLLQGDLLDTPVDEFANV